MCNNPVSLRVFNSDFDKAVKTKLSIRIGFGQTKIPCGHCLGCRLDNLALWTARCNYELTKGRSAFVTFTYDKYHLPYNECALEPTLKQIHLHRYIDNIRHKVNASPFLPYGCRKDFSYFASGEYGDTFARPHYHVLFFGLDFADCKHFFQSTWKQGSVKVLPIKNGGVRYVVDYFTKNLVSGDVAEKMYDDKGLERPFKMVSRGLGSELFFDHRDEIRNGRPLLLGSREIPVPTYYKNLFCRFSDSEITNRYRSQYESYEKIKKESERLGYQSVDDYLRYIARSNELSLETRLRNKGIPVKANYRSLGSSKNFLLVNSALEQDKCSKDYEYEIF